MTTVHLNHAALESCDVFLPPPSQQVVTVCAERGEAVRT